MNRKEFLKSSCSGACVAMSSGFLMSALLAACKTPLGVIKTSADKDNMVVIPVSAFGQSDYKLVRVSNYNYDLAIQKKEDGTFFALVMMCTHASQPLTKTGNKYYCAMHGSQFTHEGEVIKGPAAQSMIRLSAVELKGNLYVHLRDL